MKAIALRYVGRMSDDNVGIDGPDPMAEVGPQECDPGVADCGIRPGDRSGPPEESQWDISAALEEAFPIEDLATAFAADGLPDHGADPSDGAEAPAFTIENVSCIEDNRTYVEIFAEELMDPQKSTGLSRLAFFLGFMWRQVVAFCLRRPRVPFSGWIFTQGGQRTTDSFRSTSSREPVLCRSRFLSDGSVRAREVFSPSDVGDWWGMMVGSDRSFLRLVRPAREQCVHYKRQHFANDDQPNPNKESHNIVFRNCTHPARRSIGGASMSLTNEAVYGCDYRSPADKGCTIWMDNFDATKLREKPHLVRLPLFGLTGDKVVLPGSGGIFGAIEDDVVPKSKGETS